MQSIAFKLHPDYEDGGERQFTGGSLALADGATFDVAHELEQGDGVIVVSARDEVLLTGLRSYPALEETDVPEGREVTDAFAHMNRKQLDAELDKRGLPKSGTNPEKAQRLAAHDSAVEAGDQTAADEPHPEASAEGEGDPEGGE